MGIDVQGSAVRKAITAYNTEVPLTMIANAQQLKAQIHHVCRTGSVAMCHPLDLIGSVVPHQADQSMVQISSSLDMLRIACTWPCSQVHANTYQ